MPGDIGHNIQPQAVPACVPVKVGAVGAVGNAPAFKVFLHLPAAYVKEGPYHPAPHVLHAGKAPEAAAPQHVEHYAFRLVLHVMGHGYPVCAEFFKGPLKELIPLLPGRLLKGLAPGRGYGGDVQPFFIQPHPKLFAKLPHIVLIPLRLFAPYAVVQMGGKKLKAHFFLYFTQRPKQRHGIRAAADPRNHPGALRDKVMGKYGAFHL